MQYLHVLKNFVLQNTKFYFERFKLSNYQLSTLSVFKHSQQEPEVL